MRTTKSGKQRKIKDLSDHELFKLIRFLEKKSTEANNEAINRIVKDKNWGLQC